MHLEVYPGVDSITDSTNAIATSQLARPTAVCESVHAEPGYEQSVNNLADASLDTDNVFSDEGGPRRWWPSPVTSTPAAP